jgi:hypothetical protein
MVADNLPEVQVWALAADEVSVPLFADEGPMTLGRLNELRTVLAALSDIPIATLEAHPLPSGIDRSRGMSLSNASPLAEYLSQLISQTPKSVAPRDGKALYRMVVPAKVAKKLGSGLLQPMLSKSVPSGIHSALVDSSGIAGQAAFVQVAGRGAAGGIGGGVLTVAGPLIMMAVAAGLSMQIESARRQITDMLEKQQQDRLDDECNALDSCRNPLEKATAILLDRGIIGQMVGVSPKVSAIEDAMSAVRRRVARWENSLSGFPDGPVELAAIKQAFPGIEDPAGEFRVHLELAELAIELKRRVNVLQAVEHAQLSPGNPFERFMQQLGVDEKSVDDLENRVAAVVRQLSELHVDRSHGLLDFYFSLGEVDDLLRLSRELRKLSEGIATSNNPSDMAIEMVRDGDGSITVFPAHATK